MAVSNCLRSSFLQAKHNKATKVQTAIIVTNLGNNIVTNTMEIGAA